MYSCLRSTLVTPSTFLPVEGLGVDDNLNYNEVPVEILDRQVNKLRNKEVTSTKVLSRNYLVEVETWEAEANMKSCYHPLLAN